MVRTQIQITEEQQVALRELSASTGRSMSDLVRAGIDRVISGRPRHDRKERIERAIRVAGRFASGAPDGSENHDRLLAVAFK